MNASDADANYDILLHKNANKKGGQIVIVPCSLSIDRERKAQKGMRCHKGHPTQLGCDS